MSSSNSSTSGGIGLGGAVFIVFLVLKLCNVIDWSWWWVTAPLWIPITLFLVVVVVILFFVGIGATIRLFLMGGR